MLEGLVAAKHIQRLGSTLVMELPATGLPVHEADGNSTVAGEAATNLCNSVQTAQEFRACIRNWKQNLEFNYRLDKVPRGFTGSNSCRLKGLTRDLRRTRRLGSAEWPLLLYPQECGRDADSRAVTGETLFSHKFITKGPLPRSLTHK